MPTLAHIRRVVPGKILKIFMSFYSTALNSVVLYFDIIILFFKPMSAVANYGWYECSFLKKINCSVGQYFRRSYNVTLNILDLVLCAFLLCLWSLYRGLLSLCDMLWCAVVLMLYASVILWRAFVIMWCSFVIMRSALVIIWYDLF